jgi:N-acetylmuramoyl-L-alanine amidase
MEVVTMTVPKQCLARITILLFLFSLLSAVAISQTEQAAPEFRSLWITRFSWPSRDDPEKTKENIRTTFSAMAEDGFNAALFQIRGAAETLYPSKIEPWSDLIGGKDPGFDPAALAIEEAHKNGIEFHAYMNPFPLFAGRRGSKPSAPDHLFYRHGPGTKEPWVCLDSKGEPVFAEYYYLDPGVPQVQQYVRNVIMDVVRRYDVDGIHMDRIRYPGHAEYNPISLKRFYGRGNPTRSDWEDWHREQIDKFVNDLYAEIAAEKPKVVLSAAVWGIYNKYDIEGYYKFSSGYHDYYQDSLEWVRLGAIDYIVPMIYWDMKDPKPNYQELLDDFAARSDIKHVIGGQRNFRGQENVAQIEYTRKAGAPGTAIFSFARFPQLRQGIYSKRAPLPKRPWKENPETGIILGTVLDDSGAPLVDAWVSISPADGSRRQEVVFRKIWTSSADGRFAFLKVPPMSVKVTAFYEGATEPATQEVAITAGKVSQVTLKIPGSQKAENQPFFEVTDPTDGQQTSRDIVHLIGYTNPAYKISINDEKVGVFSTGAFAKDNIPVKMGENKIKIEVADDSGNEATRYLTVVRQAGRERPGRPGRFGRPPWRGRQAGRPAPSPDSLRVIQPSSDIALRPGDILNVEVRAPAGLKGWAELGKKVLRFDLHEELGPEGKGSGRYLASLHIPNGAVCDSLPLKIYLSGKSNGKKYKFKEQSESKVEIWDPVDVRVGETTDDTTPLSFGIHSVRLGGPYISEVPAGTRFEIVGKQSNRYQVRLAADLTGWAPVESVRLLPKGTAPPHLYFTSLSVNGDEKHDIVSIPYGEKVVFAVSDSAEPTNCIYLDLFNTHYAMTWGAHKLGAKVIGNVKGEQMADDWVRLTIPVQSRHIWGFWTEVTTGSLMLYVKRPPEFAPPGESPLKGLTVAVEAGHGGTDPGALGYMGTKEKTINLMAALALQKELESRGATVVQMRPGDSRPTFPRRLQYANDANADLQISIHANSGGSGQGYLREIGTSTYYKHEHSALLAEKIYKEMLGLGWGDFGVIANFNYTPLRTTRMPAILIEQAFMNMPRDEARLKDPEYQKEQAKAIARGIENFLEASRNR